MAEEDEDRLTALSEPILLHILSMLPNRKEIVRSSVLSKQWRFLWKSVSLSLNFHFPGDFPYDESIVKKKILLDFVAHTHRELHYWRCCEKIKAFRVFPIKYGEYIAKDVDLWVHFATKIAHLEDFTIKFYRVSSPDYAYQFPQFGFKNTSLKNLVLGNCMLNPSGTVNWTSLVSLSIGNVVLVEPSIMEKVLSGCPNLECLELDKVGGVPRLEINSVKLRKLIVINYDIHPTDDDVHWPEIIAPYIQHLEVLGLCYYDMRLKLRNVDSLVTVVLALDVDFLDLEDEKDKLEEECRYLQELLRSVANVQNLELGTWCTECLPVLELKGLPFPQSSWKFLKLNTTVEQSDCRGICNFLPSSSDLETLVFVWNNHKPRGLLSRYINKEQSTRFEAHNFSCSLLHLKTIKFINFYGQLSKNKFVLPLVKCLLKNATVLEMFVLAGKFKRSDVSGDYVKMTEQEFRSFPRSSPDASVVFSYR